MIWYSCCLNWKVGCFLPEVTWVVKFLLSQELQKSFKTFPIPKMSYFFSMQNLLQNPISFSFISNIFFFQKCPPKQQKNYKNSISGHPGWQLGKGYHSACLFGFLDSLVDGLVKVTRTPARREITCGTIYSELVSSLIKMTNARTRPWNGLRYQIWHPNQRSGKGYQSTDRD